MSHSKKEIVDAAVREYIDARSQAALAQLNGSDRAVSMVTGFTSNELDDLVGLPKEHSTSLDEG